MIPNIIEIILLGFSVIAIVFLGFITFRMANDRSRRWLGLDRQDIEFMFQRELRSEDRYVPRLVDELPRIIRTEITSALGGVRDEINALNSAFGSVSLQESNLMPLVDESAKLMRELSHSLYTPLSQIDAALLSLESRGNQDSNSNSDSSVQTIRQSIDICKSVLSAFRELVRVGGLTGSWSPVSIKSALSSAAPVYNKSLDRNIEVELDMPDVIPGYTNGYITALLLPLLENALESSKSGNAVNINGEKVDGHFVVAVCRRSAIMGHI